MSEEREQPGERFRVATAPGGLHLVQSVLNTTLHEWDGDLARDDLMDVDTARSWLARALPADRGSGDLVEGIALEEADLPPLREYREALRASLRADVPTRPGPTIPVEAALHLTQDAGGGLRFGPGETGWRAIAGLVIMEMMLAQARGDLKRLKTCANAPCGLAFYDRSPNVIRMWHDTRTCGNLVNLRAARRRRKAE